MPGLPRPWVLPDTAFHPWPPLAHLSGSSGSTLTTCSVPWLENGACMVSELYRWGFREAETTRAHFFP